MRFVHAPQKRESGGERRKGERQKNEKTRRFATVCGSDEVTSSYPGTYFCRGEEEIQYIIRKAEGKQTAEVAQQAFGECRLVLRHRQDRGFQTIVKIYIYIYIITEFLGISKIKCQIMHSSVHCCWANISCWLEKPLVEQIKPLRVENHVGNWGEIRHL